MASVAWGQSPVTKREATKAEMTANTEMQAGNYRLAIPAIDTVLAYIRSVENEAEKRNLVTKAETLFFYKAFCFVATEQFAEAVPLLDRFLSLYPRSVHRKTVYTLKIHSLSSLERWEDSREALEAVLKNSTLHQEERMELRMSLAEVNRTLGDHEKAFPLFRSVVSHAGDPSLKMNAISRILETIFHLQKSDLLYKLIPMLQGRVSPAVYSLSFNLKAIEAADQLMEADLHSPALVLLKLCKPLDDIREGLTRVEAYLQRRLEALQTGEQAAIENLYQMIAVQSRLIQVQAEIEAAASATDYNEGLQYRIARVLTQMDMQYESYWAYQKLLEDHPESENAPLAYYATSSIAAELGLNRRAIRQGKELLARFPDFERAPDIAFTLAYVYQQNEEIEEMLNVLQDAIDRKIVTRNQKDRGHAYFLMGYANLFLDEFDAALRWFGRVRSEVSNSQFVVDANYWSAYTMMFTDEYPEAITRFEAFLSAYPSSRYTMDATFRLALAHFGTGDLEQARSAAEAFIEAYPGSELRGEAYNLLGDVYGGLGMLDEAIEAYGLVEQFTAQPGQVHTAVFNAGRIMEADARWSQMIDHFQRYLNRYGDDGFYTRAVYEIGKAYKNSGRVQAALDLYWETFQRFAHEASALAADRLLADYVEEVQIQYVRETTRARAKARKEARAKAADTPEAQQALNRMSPEDREAARAEAIAAEAEQAERDRRIAEAEATRRVVQQLREELRRTGHEEEALTRNLRVRHALARVGRQNTVPDPITPEMLEAASPNVLLWLGDLLEQREQTNLAARAYQRIVEAFRESEATVIAYVKWGQLEFNQGRLDDALGLFTSVYENYPTSDWTGTAVMRIADILYQQENYEAAAQRYEEIVRVRQWKGPLWPEALYKMGLCLLRKGNPEKAFAYFQRVYVLYASHEEWAAKAYLESGKCLETLQRHAEAATTYREMLSNPSLAGTAAGEQARKRLEKLPPSALQVVHETPES